MNEPRTRPTVREYMTTSVDVVGATETVQDVTQKITQMADHDGFPVCEDGRLVGLVRARDLLGEPEDTQINDIMGESPPVASPEMDTKTAARVMLREGTSDLPVVEDDELVGIITHADALRSVIERSTPTKLDKLTSMLENVHDVELSHTRRSVPIAVLIPTQNRVFADELQGRQYELDRGLAEPLIVINNAGTLVLADGHHRAVAAHQSGREELDAYVIELNESIELGMQETARRQGLHTLDDVAIDEHGEHPLIEQISRVRSDPE